MIQRSKTWYSDRIAAVVAMLTRRLRLPYSVGLVAAGIILAIVAFVTAS